MKYRVLLVLLILLAVIFITGDASAQCAMCKAAAEEGAKDGNTQSATLNSGILYLLSMPYLAFGVIGILWWKHYKRRKTTGEGI